MRISVQGLQLRNRTFHFRRRVPPDLQEVVGKHEWKKSLEIEEHRKVEAVAAAAALWKETDALIARLRRERDQQKSPLEIHNEAVRWATTHGFLEGQEGRNEDASSLDGEEVNLGSIADIAFEEVVEQAGRQFGWNDEGHPNALTPLQREQLRVLATGRPMPPALSMSDAVKLYVNERWDGEPDRATEQSTKQFVEMMGDLKLSEIRRPVVMRWLQRLVDEREQNEGTVKRRLSAMKAVFNHVIRNHDVDLTNPFVNQRVPRGAKPAGGRAPFHSSHLALIDAYFQSGDVDPDVRTIATVLRCTGCRPMEVGGLSRAEVNLDAEIPFIRLEQTAERTLKNPTSSRVIPLLGAAFDVLREVYCTSSGEYLFPAWCRNTNSLSQRLKNAIRASGVPNSPRLTPYSFRHSVADGLKAAGVPHDVRLDLLGHAEQSAQRHYGSDARPLSELAAGLKAGLMRLGEVDEAQYRPGELPKMR